MTSRQLQTLYRIRRETITPLLDDMLRQLESELKTLDRHAESYVFPRDQRLLIVDGKLQAFLILLKTIIILYQSGSEYNDPLPYEECQYFVEAFKRSSSNIEIVLSSSLPLITDDLLPPNILDIVESCKIYSTIIDKVFQLQITPISRVLFNNTADTIVMNEIGVRALILMQHHPRMANASMCLRCCSRSTPP